MTIESTSMATALDQIETSERSGVVQQMCMGSPVAIKTDRTDPEMAFQGEMEKIRRGIFTNKLLGKLSVMTAIGMDVYVWYDPQLGDVPKEKFLLVMNGLAAIYASVFSLASKLGERKVAKKEENFYMDPLVRTQKAELHESPTSIQRILGIFRHKKNEETGTEPLFAQLIDTK